MRYNMENNDLTNWMQEWFEQFMGRFDRLDKFIEVMNSRHNVLNGERLLDNHDLCKLLNVSKRTLQRYRSIGAIPYQMIYHKTYYKECDVEKFIWDHFSKNNNDKEEV
ncbi:helix-turn-helix domain-containing protein [Dysgonomonas sp. HGC4]|uniref:helix-turn-helix domain-containing protein n=1 Tax=Dysgonomonas sp. HGC4 TaxID=1658009 RepID=UPI000682FF5A|nr:helix-turn-helix domain-containing protein [Dysgonomonas sp. HGC4]